MDIWLHFNPEDGCDNPRKCRALSELLDNAVQNATPFTVTAARTPNPINKRATICIHRNKMCKFLITFVSEEGGGG
jgi:hypothetical protein